ncbi:MAG TPA: flagellar biosynthesis protein FlhA [Rhodanobacteraceae bacterium]
MAEAVAKAHAGWMGGLRAPALVGPVAILLVMAMIVVPLPAFAISFLFALNIAAGLVILATSLYITKPTELTAFPSILLMTTLMRLSLNVATARIILLHGYQGEDAAGKVIESFGQFVVGGNYVVGFIIFVILIVINFVVVTKGAGRVAEVSARFVLDSLPGKQMAIDADVNAGMLNAKQAKARRAEVRQEADFFGAMDGASKFIRGDVIAAIIVLAINLIGGLIVGVLQHGLPFVVAARTYSLLTIGDGLAAQIPSLTISIAAGLVVTRVASGKDIGSQMALEISHYPKALYAGAGLMGVLGIVPGMAHWPFLLFAALLALAARWASRRAAGSAPATDAGTPPGADAPDADTQTAHPENATFSGVDTLGIEIGFALVPLVQSGDGKLLARLRAVRDRFGAEMGFEIPPVYVRDSDRVTPNQYQFTVRGAPIAYGEIWPEMWLAVQGPAVIDKLTEGKPTRDPAYGAPARWINAETVEKAEALGYTVAGPQSVLATHLDKLLGEYAYEVLGRQQVEKLLGELAKRSPKLVEDLNKHVSVGNLQRVLRNFLAERIPIKDMERIAEAVLEGAIGGVKDPDALYELARRALGRFIVERADKGASVLDLAVLDTGLEQLVAKSVETARSQGINGVIEPGVAARVRAAGAELVERSMRTGTPAVLAVRADVRRQIAMTVPDRVSVIALEEIPRDKRVRVVVRVPSAPVETA